VTVFVVLSALVFWAGVFAVYFVSQGTSPLEYLFGQLEPLPDDLNQWRARTDESGLVREERLLLPANESGGSTFVCQVRYRNPLSGEIVRVEPEQRVKRRRVRSSSR
jgi:hypothetical protein